MATRLMHHVEESDTTEGPWLMQCKLTLADKLQKLHTLDEEILTNGDNEAVEDEIEQADVFNKKIQQTVIHLEHLITAKSTLPSHMYLYPTNSYTSHKHSNIS